MEAVRLGATVLARFLISLVFLAGGINKILHWRDVERAVLTSLGEWQSRIGFIDGMQDFFLFLIGWTPLLLLIATLFELCGGLSVLLGIKEKWGAAMLILFLIPSTIIMHEFWFAEGALREMQLTHFLKNMAILGGLFLILLQGTEGDRRPF